MERMKTKNLLAATVATAVLALAGGAQANERENEQSINSSDVPAVVQQAAQAEAKGGSIIRWEKEGANYEAVIQKKRKQVGVEIDANGRVLSKHEETKEHKKEGSGY